MVINNKYKIISMDFDGTLLTSNKEITEKTKCTLLKLKQNNYVIVGITGRNLSSTKSVVDISIFDYLILSAGAYLYDVKNNKIIKETKFENDAIQILTKHFKDIAKRIEYCSINNYYIYTYQDYKYSTFRIHIDNLDQIDETIGKINIFYDTDDEMNNYKEYIQNTFENVNIVAMRDSDDKNNTKWLELNLKGTNKFDTLKVLCSKLSVSTDEVVFFGDSTNDLSVIKNVGLGVAMGNALQELKVQASHITLSNDEDGIAVFLNKYIS